MKTDEPLIPLVLLTPAVFSILRALAFGKKHGDEIMKQDCSAGRRRLAPRPSLGIP